MTLMMGEWKAMLTRKRVNRYPISFSLSPRRLTASVPPLRTTWFGALILPMWTSFSSLDHLFQQIQAEHPRPP